MENLNNDLEKVTSIYPVLNASVVPMMTKKVPDIVSGKVRNRKLAAYFSIAIIRDLTQHQDPIIIQGDMPQLLVDGDHLSDIRERLVEQIDIVFGNAQDLLDGKVSMVELEEKAENEAAKMEAEAKARMQELMDEADAEEGAPSPLKLVK